jgi:hypothetical protein
VSGETNGKFSFFNTEKIQMQTQRGVFKRADLFKPNIGVIKAELIIKQ